VCRAGGDDHQCGPDELRHAAQEVEQQARRQPWGEAESASRRQCQQAAPHHRQQRADGGDGEGLQGAPGCLGQKGRRQIGREELAHEPDHEAHRFAAEKLAIVDG
jgi:hypothetical protein